MRRILFVIVLIAVSFSGYSQDTNRNKGLFYRLDVMKSYEFSYSSKLSSGASTFNESSTNTLRGTLGYFLNPNISMGVGIGVENSSIAGNSAPLFFDVRYYLWDKKNTPFIFVSSGSFLKASNTFEKGEFFDVGVGCKFFTGKKFCLNTAIGYDLRRYTESQALILMYDNNDSLIGSAIVDNPITFHSLSLSIGILF